MFPDKFYKYLQENTLIGVKAGKERTTFLNIWMVQVNHRVFARSWNKSEKSWFTEFQNSGIGQLKYEDQTIDVTGIRLDENDDIHRLIDQAFLKKYTQEENIKYARGISQAEYSKFTMEFLNKN